MFLFVMDYYSGPSSWLSSRDVSESLRDVTERLRDAIEKLHAINSMLSGRLRSATESSHAIQKLVDDRDISSFTVILIDRLFFWEVLKFLDESADFIYTYVRLRWTYELVRILFSYWIAFTEWPGGRRRALSTTWPWNVKTSLMVLWGVCWMFYESPGLNNSLDPHLIDLFDERPTTIGDYNPYPEEFLNGYAGIYSKPYCSFSNVWLI